MVTTSDSSHDVPAEPPARRPIIPCLRGWLPTPRISRVSWSAPLQTEVVGLFKSFGTAFTSLEISFVSTILVLHQEDQLVVDFGR